MLKKELSNPIEIIRSGNRFRFLPEGYDTLELGEILAKAEDVIEKLVPLLKSIQYDLKKLTPFFKDQVMLASVSGNIKKSINISRDMNQDEDCFDEFFNQEESAFYNSHKLLDLLIANGLASTKIKSLTKKAKKLEHLVHRYYGLKHLRWWLLMTKTKTFGN